MSNSEKIARILFDNEQKNIAREFNGLITIGCFLDWKDLLPTDQNTFLTLADTICDAVGIKRD